MGLNSAGREIWFRARRWPGRGFLWWPAHWKGFLLLATLFVTFYVILEVSFALGWFPAHPVPVMVALAVPANIFAFIAIRHGELVGAKRQDHTFPRDRQNS